MDYYKIYLLAILIMSLITLFVYFADKRRAIKKRWRIKESVLLSCSFFGGAIGGLMGLYLVRHKTKHWYFVVINWVSLVIQIYLFFYLYNI